jgi:DUF1680 family protein
LTLNQLNLIPGFTNMEKTFHKHLYAILNILLIPCLGIAQPIAVQKNIRHFPLTDVRLLESPFKQAEQTDLKYILALDPDKLLAPYLREAGIPPKATSYGNWENTGLDGHIGGHYLTALSLMYASTGDQEVLRRLNYMLAELKKCQDKNGNGYIGGVPGGNAMWADISSGKIDAASFSLNKKWVPWYNIHKLYAGLRDAHLYTGNALAKEMLIKLSDWSLNLVSKLSDAQIQQMLVSEHGGMNEIFADVATITGEEKYMTLAKKFSHQVILSPLLKQKDELNGLHANTQIPKVIGYKRIADLSQNEEWNKSAAFFWETVVHHRSVAIGGNSVREHFHPANDFSSMLSDVQGPETCNTYNMLKLSNLLYQSSGDLKYIDYYEKALYNHILSSQQPDRGGFVYFTPMRPGHYRVYSQPETSFWCCVGSGLENHAKYGELIYAHTDQDLYVNLFIPSAVNWEEKGLTITQQTHFPDEANTQLLIETKKPQRFNLKIRYPIWVQKGGLKISVNGKIESAEGEPGNYVTLFRKWKSGDKVEIHLPMETRAEELPGKPEYQAFFYGPVLLASKIDANYMDGLYADDSRGGHIAHGKLYPSSAVPLMVSAKEEVLHHIKPVAGKPLTFTASSVIYPNSFKNTELIPFFRLHDARYTIYWQVLSKEELKENQEKSAAQENEQLAKEKNTIDQVNPGQQQPESDHFFKGERTSNGVFRDRQYRDARGWFSYQLKDKGKQAKNLQITCYGLDTNREFDIFINDLKLSTVKLDGTKGDRFFEITIPLTTEILKSINENITLRFQAKNGSIAGGIYNIRLMK